jgi:hypothetical protein
MLALDCRVLNLFRAEGHFFIVSPSQSACELPGSDHHCFDAWRQRQVAPVKTSPG